MVHSWQSPHLRDIIVTEDGLADIRGKSDRGVAVAMLGIADSRFQDVSARERFSEIEQRLIPALQILKLASSTELLALFARVIFSSSKDWDCLRRLGLAGSSKPVEWLYSALVSGALRPSGKEF